MPKSLAECSESNNAKRLSKIGTEIVAFLKKCDKILFVEGPTDKKFYYSYGNGRGSFFFTQRGYTLNTGIKNSFLNFSNKDEWKYIGKDTINKKNINRPTKEKIEVLILNKILQCESPTHIYGIVDMDYDEKVFDDRIKEYIMVTDANSLETLLLYCAERNGKHLQFLEDYFKKRTKFSIPNKIIEQIYFKAMEFALRIGCLRKEKGGDRIKRFAFSPMLEGNSNFGYLDYCTLGKKGFLFDFNSYCEKLIYPFKKYNNDADIQNESKEIYDIISHAGDKDEEKFKLCQGHDVVALIDVMGYRYLYEKEIIKNINEYIQDTPYGQGDAGFAFIEAFNIDWFEESTISGWLRKKNEEAGTILSSPYQGYVIPITGSLDQ